MIPTRPLAAFALSALAAPALAQSDVWIVDEAGGSGSDFTLLGDAITAAADGDVLVFRPGYYYINPFLPQPIEKGLTLVAESEARLARLDVRNLAPGQTLTIRGFHATTTLIELTSCAGTVWLEDLTFVPDVGIPEFFDVAADDCAAVVVNRCDLRGLPFVGISRPALRAYSSSVHVYDSVLTGGAGHVLAMEPGTVGLLLQDSSCFAQGTAFVPGALGTEAAKQTGASDSIVLDTEGDFVVDGGTHAQLAGTKRSFEATAIAREGESVTMSWAGAPGEIAVMNLSLSASGFYLPQYHGSGVIGLPLFLVQGVGVIPASGETSVQVPIPELGAGVEGLVVYAQGSFADLSAGAIRLGGGSAIVLLDQAL
jgi:hypothetical protein